MALIKRIDPSKDPEFSDWYTDWKKRADDEKQFAIRMYGKKLNYKWSADKVSDKEYKLKIDIDESADNNWAVNKLRIIVKSENGEYKELKGENNKAKESLEFKIKFNPAKILVYRRFDAKPLYGEYKKVLVKEYKYRCAYCESLIGHIDHGDVEHFRPKGNVEDDPEHPGYYWLAYDESNFLLSCAKCNQSGGKLNDFPVEGKRVYSHDENMNIEKSLLLNPYIDETLDHLEFCPDDFEMCKGPVKGKTAKGKKSVEVYNLNRDLLKTERNFQQTNFLNALVIKLTQNLGNITSGFRLQDELPKLISDFQYQSACIAVANAWRENLKKTI
ncbi:MAG TPA: hypothetical protein VJ455_11340 [Ignavibacteria bacterium]|nr:hypothetical protein [Ignavibacteria bacterium]